MSVRLRKWKDRSGQVQQAWWVDVKYMHPTGRIERVRKASPVNTRRGAEEIERQIRHALLTGTYGKEKNLEEKRTPTLSEFVARFLVEAENNNKPSTLDAKKTALELHILPFFGRMRLDAIGLADIEEFKAAMKKKNSGARPRKADASKWAVKKRYGAPAKLLSLKSINNVLAILRRLLSLAYEHGVIASMPRVKLFRTEKTVFDFLDFDEAERLLHAAEPEWRTLILMALKTGLRMGELVGLQWTDLDLVRGKVHVRRTIWRGQTGLPKGGRTRVVDLPHSVVRELKAHRRPGFVYVFAQADGSPLTPGKMKTPLNRALRKSGISRAEGRIGWHDLRHTYGSHLAMRGQPLKVIQELMGHATIEMTMRYAHLSPDVRHNAVQALDQPAPALAAAADAAGAHAGHIAPF